MSQYAAAAWADLAVDLSGRLAATGAALAAGIIDVPRARLITEATTLLSEENARAVEARVLPAAGSQTSGMLRAALRRAVLAIDPAGAEQRRKDAERRARVVLYPDQDQTATLAGQRMPVIHAAAAMARLKAMARARQADGDTSPLDLICAQIYIALLLGTPTPDPTGARRTPRPAARRRPDPATPTTTPADPTTQVARTMTCRAMFRRRMCHRPETRTRPGAEDDSPVPRRRPGRPLPRRR